jgi:5-methylcytosine-specific restriction endonuclease McrA
MPTGLFGLKEHQSMGKERRVKKTSSTRPAKPKSERSADDFLRAHRKEQESKQVGVDYRTASLKIHGHVCARCGREFTMKNLRELTVHHIDGNDRNNPPDGSNWENLCTYCHDAEHSRERLAEYVSGAQNGGGSSRGETSGDDAPKATLADLLKAASEKKKK